MGGDGGSIPGRADMIKTKGLKFARNLGGMGYNPNLQVREGTERYTTLEQRELRCKTCALTQEPLRTPLVGCRLGRVYNKDSLLKALLSKQIPEGMNHVKSLKDVKTLKVELNEASGAMTCGVTHQDIEKSVKAVILWTCGCVVSRKALDVVGTARECPLCSRAYDPSKDIIALIPDEKELIELEDRILPASEGVVNGRKAKPPTLKSQRSRSRSRSRSPR